MEMRRPREEIDMREVIKRKVPNSRVEFAKDYAEDEVSDLCFLSFSFSKEEEPIAIGQRRVVQPRRRLGERLGLAGRWGSWGFLMSSCF